MVRRLVLAWLSMLAAPAAAAATPLFASDQPLRLALRGPIAEVLRGNQRDAQLALASPATETLAVRLSPRGITRRKSEICAFPPLRVELTQKPAATSLFARQRRLKLVTHCRREADFQQKVLLEYAAYRLFNLVTPASFRARLAEIDYVDSAGRPVASRWGFFIEDVDDLARRVGMREARVGDSVPASLLSPRESARYALFQYMIGNLDWSMRAGPKGAGCCHNSRLLSPRSGAGALVPVPYDFDFSGLVDAPYATPPEGIPLRSVRTRRYRGLCAHDREALVEAAALRARRSEMIALFDVVPGLEPRTRRRATDYLGEFFDDIADDQRVTARLLRTCVRQN